MKIQYNTNFDLSDNWKQQQPTVTHMVEMCDIKFYTQHLDYIYSVWVHRFCVDVQNTRLKETIQLHAEILHWTCVFGCDTLTMNSQE